MKVYQFTMGMLALYMAGTVTKSLTDNKNLKLPKRIKSMSFQHS